MMGKNNVVFLVLKELVKPLRIGAIILVGLISLVNSAFANKLFVANGDDDTVSVIDTVTNLTIATVTVGQAPLEIAITPDGQFAYVTNPSSDNVSVINTSTYEVVETIAVGNQPSAVAITPDGQFAYVSNYQDDTVSVINTLTYAIEETISVGNGPNGIAFAPNGEFAYVANYLADTVSVIDTTTYELSGPISVGDAPYNLILCAANIALQGGVKSADDVVAFFLVRVESAALLYTVE